MRRCSRRSRDRREFCSPAKPCALPSWSPTPDYPEPVALGLRCRGRALIAAGARSSPCRGLGRATSRASISSCRSSPGVITCDYANWLACSTASSARECTMLNPPALLRWNGDKAYLAELADARSSHGSNACGRNLAAMPILRKRGDTSTADVAGDQAAGVGQCVWHASSWSERRFARRQPTAPNDHSAADRGDRAKRRILADALRRRIQPRGRQAPRSRRLPGAAASRRMTLPTKAPPGAKARAAGACGCARHMQLMPAWTSSPTTRAHFGSWNSS